MESGGHWLRAAGWKCPEIGEEAIPDACLAAGSRSRSPLRSRWIRRHLRSGDCCAPKTLRRHFFSRSVDTDSEIASVRSGQLTTKSNLHQATLSTAGVAPKYSSPHWLGSVCHIGTANLFVVSYRPRFANGCLSIAGSRHPFRYLKCRQAVAWSQGARRAFWRMPPVRPLAAHTLMCKVHKILCLWGRRVTYAEFQLELRKSGLSVVDFAQIVGMRANSVSNYARAERIPQHLALIAVLLAELAACGRDYRSVADRVNITRKRPRGRGRPGRFGGDPQAELDWRV